METSLNYGHEEGKPEWQLLFDDFKLSLEAVLEARQYGAKKYSRFNWLASCCTEDHDIFLSKNRASRFRHLLAESEETFDPESECYHAALEALRALIHLEYVIRAEKEGFNEPV